MRWPKVGHSRRRTLWFVPTPPQCSCSSGARIQGSSFGGQVTSSSAKIVMQVRTSGMARTIWRRLFGCVILHTRILEVHKLFTMSLARIKFSSTVTKMISCGSVANMLRIVSQRSGPSPWSDGMMTVTSSGPNVGSSARGMGLSLQKAKRFTTSRR